jgi:hypothetical protein
MALIKLEVEVPKEMNDIREFIVKLIVDIKAKKPLAEIGASSLPGLIASIEGYDQLDEEAKMKESYNLYGLLVADIAKALLVKAPVA